MHQNCNHDTVTDRRNPPNFDATCNSNSTSYRPSFVWTAAGGVAFAALMVLTSCRAVGRRVGVWSGESIASVERTDRFGAGAGVQHARAASDCPVCCAWTTYRPSRYSSSLSAFHLTLPDSDYRINYCPSVATDDCHPDPPLRNNPASTTIVGVEPLSGAPATSPLFANVASAAQI